MDIGHFLELTFTAIIIYLVLRDPSGFANIVKAGGDVYAKSVSTLQGR